jgi:hypothetical protein
MPSIKAIVNYASMGDNSRRGRGGGCSWLLY